MGVRSLWRIAITACLVVVAGPLTGSAGEFEDKILEELNRARTMPDAYIKQLKERHQKDFYKGNTFEPPGAVPLTTKEGFAAVEAAIKDLEAIQGLDKATGPGQEGKRPETFRLSTGMSKAALDHAKDPSSDRPGNEAHIGSDGSRVDQRIAKHGDPRLIVQEGNRTFTSRGSAENIGFGTTAQQIVERLIIDDGISTTNPGHRRNILASQHLSKRL